MVVPPEAGDPDSWTPHHPRHASGQRAQPSYPAEPYPPYPAGPSYPAYQAGPAQPAYPPVPTGSAPGMLPQPAYPPEPTGLAPGVLPQAAYPPEPTGLAPGVLPQTACPPYSAPGAMKRTRRGWLRSRAWLLALIPLGSTTWAGFLYIGIRARRPQWLAWAAVYAGLFAASWILESPANAGTTTSGGVGVLLGAVAWLGGGAHALAISGSAARRIDDRNDPALKAARERVRRRAEGRKLLARDPQLAKEAGLGRPDLLGADDYGLVDVNHATAPALRLLPGITEETVQQVLKTRAELGGFSSVEDVGAALSLPPNMVEQMRDVAVFVL